MGFFPLWRRLPILLALGIVLLSCGPAQASGPRDELLRLVPEDVSLCLVINNLREQTEKILARPWVNRLRASPLGQELAKGPEAQKLAQFDRALRLHLQISPGQLRDDILGDAVVFAFHHAPPGKPDQERGLLLLWARDAALLGKLVERINQEQQKSGELKALQPREHKGVKYFRRQALKGEHFYYLQGPLLAFSGREAMLQEVIERHLRQDKSQKSPRQAGPDKALVSLWINPRAFDAELQEKAAQGRDAEAQVLKTLLEYWQALDGVTLALAVDQDIELTLTLQGRSEALPASARPLAQATSRPSELWGRFPQPTLLTVAGRVDVSSVSKAFSDFLTPEARQQFRQTLRHNARAALGMDLTEDVLPCLGPDWGLCIAAAPDKAQFPHVLAALRVQPGAAPAPVDQAVFNALQLFLGLAVFEYNRTHDDPMHLKSAVQDKVSVKYLVNDKLFPPGLEPCCALKDGYLILASSPEAIRRFAAASAEEPTEAPLLRLSLQELSRFLSARRELVVNYLSAKHQTSPEAASHCLDGLLWGLNLFEHVELRQQRESGQATWTLRLRPASEAGAR